MAYVSNEVTIVVEPAPAPAPAPSVSVVLSADKTRVKVGETVTFTVTVTGLDGWWNVDLVERTRGWLAGTGAWLVRTGSAVTILWTPREPGTYYVHAEVWSLPVYW